MSIAFFFKRFSGWIEIYQQPKIDIQNQSGTNSTKRQGLNLVLKGFPYKGWVFKKGVFLCSIHSPMQINEYW
jgi:hypothetical protein